MSARAFGPKAERCSGIASFVLIRPASGLRKRTGCVSPSPLHSTVSPRRSAAFGPWVRSGFVAEGEQVTSPVCVAIGMIAEATVVRVALAR